MAILGILLTILKIIGIILLVLLGIVLFVVAVILLVPIRYEGEGRKEETLCGHIKITWLLHLISASASLSPDGTNICIRIAGKTIYPKSQKPPKQKASKQKPSKQSSSKQNLPNQPAVLSEEIKEVYEPTVPKQEPKTNSQTEQIEQKLESKQQQREEDKETQSQTKKKNTNSSEQNINSSEQDTSSKPKKDPISFLKQKFDAVKQKLLSLKKKLVGIKTNLQKTKEKLDYWKNLLLSDPMKEAFSTLMKKAKALLRHILPTKLSGRVHFGFEDPSLTGKILAYLSMVYPFTKDTLIIEPEFETQELILEGNLSFRGRIRLGYLLYLVLSVVLNKNIRRQYKRLRQGGKEDGEGRK